MPSSNTSRSWQQRTDLPQDFINYRADQLIEAFPQPTLVSLEGKKPEALFVAILMHGNEYSGLSVMQRLLAHYSEGLPRRIHLFIANIEAAARQQRSIDGQEDFNRCWPGSELADSDTTQMLSEVWHSVTDKPLFAAIDLHNNTGPNPHYGCISDTRHENQYICSLFNHIAMVFERPKGVCSMSFDRICPAATLECGRPGEPLGIAKAYDVIDTLLHLDHFPDRDVLRQDLQLVQTLASLYVDQDSSFGFAEEEDDVLLRFCPGFEQRNFTELQPDEAIARSENPKAIIALDQHGEDITTELIRQENSQLFLNKTLIAAMITADKDIIRKDCLCYLLQDYPTPENLTP